MSDDDEWRFWREQLAGNNPETQPGCPMSGFYKDTVNIVNAEGKRDGRVRAVAIWREDGRVHWSMSAGYEPQHLDELDDRFSFFCRDALTYDEWLALSERGSDPVERKPKNAAEMVPRRSSRGSRQGSARIALGNAALDD